MKAIGLDIGTTAVSGVLLDAQTGEVLAHKSKNSNAFLIGQAEWEKLQSVDKILEIAREILEFLINSDVAVIGVTGQMHGMLYFDPHGAALSPLYTWQDERGNLPYKDSTYAEFLNSFSGYGCVTDFYNKENGIRPIGAAGFCTIQDFVVMKLCKLQKPLLHTSNAASFGCFDLEKNKFNYDVDLDITADYRIAGEYKGIPVAVAIGDNQASTLSSLADENSLLLNVGTGSQVSLISKNPNFTENIEARPYFDGKYLLVGSALCGGRAYSLLKNFYAELLNYKVDVDENAVYEIMEKMLKNVDATSLTVDTRFAGTRSNKMIRGSISGITTENLKPSQLTLAVLEGMANELYTMYESMNVKKCGIVGSGNGVRRNSTLIYVFERIFGAKMRVPKHLEEAAVGAALYGLVSCGFFKNVTEAQKLIKYV